MGASPIHRWGVYAGEAIPARRKVIEYTGEKLNRRETKRREMEGRATGALHYIFALTDYWNLDGAVGGSGAEFINHSCEPNLVSRIVKGHILYCSACEIEPGAELTVDYRFAPDVEAVSCRCSSGICRGTINVKRRVSSRTPRTSRRKQTVS